MDVPAVGTPGDGAPRPALVPSPPPTQRAQTERVARSPRARGTHPDKAVAVSSTFWFRLREACFVWCQTERWSTGAAVRCAEGVDPAALQEPEASEGGKGPGGAACGAAHRGARNPPKGRPGPKHTDSSLRLCLCCSRTRLANLMCCWMHSRAALPWDHLLDRSLTPCRVGCGWRRSGALWPRRGRISTPRSPSAPHSPER